MRKIWLVIFAVVAFALMGCPADDNLECYGRESFATIDYIATSNFDSARIYLGDNQICYAGQEGTAIRKSCKLSLKSDYKIVDDGDGVNCLASDEYPQWFWFSCSFNEELDGVNMEIADLTIEVFSNDSVNKTIIKNFNLRALTSGFIPASDTTNFWRIDELVRLFVDPVYSQFWRKGCYDGLCVFQDKFPAASLCVEK